MEQRHERRKIIRSKGGASTEEGSLRSLDLNEVKETSRVVQKLFVSIEAGEYSVVEKILKELTPDARRSIFDQFNDRGFNLLHLAIARKKASLVLLLIEQGANITTKTREEKQHTPMELAVISDDDDVIDLLLDNLQNAKALAGHLAEAIKTGKKKYAKKLLARLNNKEWLESRAQKEGWSEQSVADIAKVRSREDGVIHAYTALDEAVRQGDLDMVQRVLAIPAFRQRINQEGREGRSALHWACYLGNKEIFLALIQPDPVHPKLLGADTMMRAADGGTILHHAVMGGDRNLEFIRFLLDIDGFPANFLNALDSENKSPLYHACQLGAQALINELCNTHHAALTREGNVSPLHIACERGDLETTRQLLAYAPEVAENWMQNFVYAGDKWVHDPELDTPYESAVTREFEDAPPHGIVAVQEELLSFMHRRMGEGAKEAVPLMQFKSNIFIYALNSIKAIPDKTNDIAGSHENTNLKNAMLAMYNCLSNDYQDVIEETNPKKRQSIISRNNKILCLTRQLDAMAERFALGKGTKQEIANDFKNYCAKKIYSDKIKNLVCQVIGGIVGGLFFGAVGFAVGLGISAGPAAPFTATAGAVKGVIAGAAAGAAVAGAFAGASTVRQFLTTLKLQMCIWKVNQECKKQAKIPQEDNLRARLHPSSQSESERRSQQDSEQLSDERNLLRNSSSPR